MLRFAYSAPKAEGSNRDGERRLALAIYDQIGPMGVTAADVQRAITASGELDAIDVSLHSPGGSALDGVAIYNLLRASPATVRIRIDGMALSAASIVAMAGDRIEMAEGALLMIHDPWSMSVGTAADHNHEAEVLDLVRDSLAGIYASRLNSGSEDEARRMMAEETWLTATEAIALGLADDVRDAPLIAAYGELSRFEHPVAFKGSRSVDAAFLEWALARGIADPTSMHSAAKTQARTTRIQPDADDHQPIKPLHPAAASTAEERTNPPSANPVVLERYMHPRVLAALDLADSAEVDAVVSAIKAAKAVEAQLAEVTDRANMAEALGTIRAWKDAAARHDEAAAELAELKIKAVKTEADTLIKDASTGAKAKLTPALAEFWRGQIGGAEGAQADGRLAQLKAYLAAATPFLPGRSEQPATTTDPLGTYDGKAFRDMKPLEQAQLRRTQPELYAALRAAAMQEAK